MSAFGVFDGHGGKQAATHAAKGLLQAVARYAERAVGAEPPATAGPAAPTAQLAAEGYLPPDSEGDPEAVARARVAAAQDALMSRLPRVRAGAGDGVRRKGRVGVGFAMQCC